jgi:hypothetical protein
MSAWIAGGKILKLKYEKPIAMPLGEALKGSGECNAGSGVMPSGSTCSTGTGASGCSTGTGVGGCSFGTGVIIV